MPILARPGVGALSARRRLVYPARVGITTDATASDGTCCCDSGAPDVCLDEHTFRFDATGLALGVDLACAMSSNATGQWSLRAMRV